KKINLKVIIFIKKLLILLDNQQDELENIPSEEIVDKLFPFKKFFFNVPQPLFQKKSLQKDKEIADSCFKYIKDLFSELKEYRALELLRTPVDRANYLVTRQAKIIAMTCTHAALKVFSILLFKY